MNKTTINDCRVLKISDLKKMGLLKNRIFSERVFKWNNDNSIRALINTIDVSASILFRYTMTTTGEQIEYKIKMIQKPTNLGFKQWFFVCPATGVICRNLYFYEGYFLSRQAQKLLYESQFKPKSWRAYEVIFWYSKKEDECHQALRKPYFKPIYRGKPTSTYQRIHRRLERAELTDRQAQVVERLISSMHQ